MGTSYDSYELGFAAETGWRAIVDPDKSLPEPPIPPFDYVLDMLNMRLEGIKAECKTDKEPVIYLTEGRTFRFDIAKKKPYKGQRVENKPWHFNNLTVYLRDVLGAKVITKIEADDALAIDHIASNGTTIICSRDKDLRQVPGWLYSWELGKQPSFGPAEISKAGSLSLSDDRKKLTGTGLAFFYAQVLMGDTADNIPGLPGCGPVQAYEALNGPIELFDIVSDLYRNHYGNDWKTELLEQGQLCWMTRRLHPDGSPVLWELGMED